MLILMELYWVWIGIGVGLMLWGHRVLEIRWRDWVGFLVSWFTAVVGDETKAEKQVLKEMKASEELAANPGCGLVMVGALCLLYGLMGLI